MNRRGFTLPEVLVVMVILSVGVLPLALIQTRAREEVVEANRFTQAFTVAQDRLEWARGQGFGNAVADSGLEGHVNWRTTVRQVSFGLEQVEVRVIFQQGATPDTFMVCCLMSMR